MGSTRRVVRSGVHAGAIVEQDGEARCGKADIQRRSFSFAVRIVRLVRSLPKDVGAQTIARQLARSGMGVGANIEEAQSSHSRVDFARRMNIARGEARETLYWLRLIGESEMLPQDRLQPLLVEAEEVVRILTAIVKTARDGR